MAKPGFSYFIMLAEMRTGSNFLEANLNQFADLQSYGELFNPHFVGGAKKDELLGITLNAREKDPFQLLEAIKGQDESIIPGFRFFYDHDPRILQHCLNDSECGKIILTRNPLDCYVSRKIAGVTGQWKLTNIKHKKTAKVDFDAGEFAQYLENAQQFQVRLLNALQISGQTAFYINYDDLNSLDVLNGLARFLGSEQQVESLDKSLKRQNSPALENKVTNVAEMTKALGEMDFLALSRTPNFEPRRGAAVPSYVGGNTAPLLFAPIKASPVQPVLDWLAAHDKVAENELAQGFNQKSLRQWWRDHPHFQSFTVLRHPVARAYFSFCEYILSDAHGAYRDLRKAVIRDYKVPIPKKGADAGGYDLVAHKAAFLAFLAFLKANLANQTSLRIDQAWASQSAVIQGFTTVAPLGHVFHESNLSASLAYLESLTGLTPIDISPSAEPSAPFALTDIYDQEIEKKTRDVYLRDYLSFGFEDWRP